MPNKIKLLVPRIEWPVVITIAWYVFIIVLSIFNFYWAQRPVKLNEWADFLAGFSSIPILGWVIATYRQRDWEIKEQKAIRENQITPILRLTLNDTKPASNSQYLQLNFRLKNIKGFCYPINIFTENSTQLTLAELPRNAALHPGDTLEFSTNVPCSNIIPKVRIMYSNIDGQGYSIIFTKRDIFETSNGPPFNTEMDPIE